MPAAQRKLGRVGKINTCVEPLHKAVRFFAKFRDPTFFSEHVRRLAPRRDPIMIAAKIAVLARAVDKGEIGGLSVARLAIGHGQKLVACCAMSCSCPQCRERSMTTAKEVLQAARLVAANPQIVESFERDDPHFAKARGPHAPDLTERERVRDPMNDPHGDFRREQLYGRKTEASGAGAEELSRRSSTPVSGQADETSALGEALERGVSELEKGVRLLRDALARARNQAVYPDSNGRNGGAEKQPREEGEPEEEEDETAKGLAAAPTFRTLTTPDGIGMLEMNAKELFNLLMSPTTAVAKANAALVKARNAASDPLLSSEHAGMASNLLLHVDAARKGIYPMQKAIGELANQPAEVLGALLRAIRS